MRPIYAPFARIVACLAVCFAGAMQTTAHATDETPPQMSKGFRFIQSDGETLYRATCQGCHMPHAEGAKGAGMYPALARNPQVATSAYVAYVVLQGRNGMPNFNDRMSDEQIAAVVNFVRTNFGNRYDDPVLAADVAKMR